MVENCLSYALLSLEVLLLMWFGLNGVIKAISMLGSRSLKIC